MWMDQHRRHLQINWVHVTTITTATAGILIANAKHLLRAVSKLFMDIKSFTAKREIFWLCVGGGLYWVHENHC